MNKDMEYMYNWINDDSGWREEWDPIDLNITEWPEDPDFFKEKETSNGTSPSIGDSHEWNGGL